MRRVLVVGLVVTGCSNDPEATARVTLAPSGTEPIAGEGTFTLQDGAVSLAITFTAGPSGGHGLALHAGPSCAEPGASWDVLGAIDINSNGDGAFELSRPGWTLGDGGAMDVAPRVLIVYDAGPGTPKLACGPVMLDP